MGKKKHNNRKNHKYTNHDRELSDDEFNLAYIVVHRLMIEHEKPSIIARELGIPVSKVYRIKQGSIRLNPVYEKILSDYGAMDQFGNLV